MKASNRKRYSLVLPLTFAVVTLLLFLPAYSDTSSDQEAQGQVLIDPAPSIQENAPDQQPQAESTEPQAEQPAPQPGPEEVSLPEPAPEEPLPPLVEDGSTVSGVIDLSSGTPYATYRFKVPENAMRVVISLSGAKADLDLFARHGSSILDYSMVDAKSASDDYNEKMVLSRFGEEGLYDGEYYLDVAYQREYPPRRNGRIMERIDFNLSIEYQTAQVEQVISSGDQVSGILKPEEGMMKLYAVRTDGWDSALRLDISDTTGDIDLFISRDNPNLTPETADYSSESLLGRESVVIDGNSFPAFSSGTYYVLLVDQVSDRFPVLFSLWTSKESDPPGELLSIPPIPDPDDPIQHAIGATVEVVGSEGRGSGCVVSEDGYLITNWHVVRDGENKPSDPVYIAFTLNQHIPPKELFEGRVVRYDEDLDLALIKITGGRYGQPIPLSYRFPYFEMGDAENLRIGQPVSILGYPSNGGIGSRVSITLTRGIVSGFEASPVGTFVKTDGEISFGNSGGAVFDAFGELLGLPSSIYTDGDGKLGFVLPVTMIPPSWLKIMAGTH